MLTEAPVAIFVFLTSEMNLELYLVHCAVCLTTIDNHGWFDYLQLHEGNFQPSTAILAPVSLRSTSSYAHNEATPSNSAQNPFQS